MLPLSLLLHLSYQLLFWSTDETSVLAFQPMVVSGPNPHLNHQRLLHNRFKTTRTRTSIVLNSISSSSTSTTTATTTKTSFDRCDVAIFGGGFGGLYTALALSREAAARNRKKLGGGQRRLDIALVDPSDNFVFLPLLYDLTVGTATEGEVCPRYADLLEGTGVRHIRATFDGFVVDDQQQQQQRLQERGANGMKMALLSTGSRNNSVDRQNKKDDDDDDDATMLKLSFDACVLSVGATPQSILASVPGAARYAQPFYTQQDAKATRDVLYRMDQKIREGQNPNIAVVGGGYGGVELAACIVRRLPQAKVTLMTRGPPMKGTRAEPLINQALQKLGVTVEMSTVQSLTPWKNGVDDDGHDDKDKSKTSQLLRMDRISLENGGDVVDQPWDVVFWTAGSSPSYPVPEKVGRLALTQSGRIQVDDTLRCSWNDVATTMMNTTITSNGNNNNQERPSVWALGDCSEIVSEGGSSSRQPSAPAVPRTAQAALQQADVVAANLLLTLDGNENGGDGRRIQKFQFLDLGSVLSLGGPNGAYLGPSDSSTLGPLVTPLVDTARVGLNLVDQLFNEIIRSPTSSSKMVDGNENNGGKSNVELATIVENLGLSLGGYGLGVDPSTAPGTLSGTLSGAARRAIYAVRMPTNKQRAYAVASAAIASAAALAKEAADQVQKNDDR